MIIDHIFKSIKLFKNGSYNIIASQEDYTIERLAQNVKREGFLSAIIFLLNVPRVLFDIIFMKATLVNEKAYLYLFYSHLFLSAFTLGFIIFVCYIYKYNKLKRRLLQITHVSFCFIFISLSIFMSINMLQVQGQISSYFIALFSFAATIIYTPLELVLIFVPTLIFFIFNLLPLPINYASKTGFIMNILFGFIIAFLISLFTYMTSIKEFSKKRLTEDKNRELFRLRLELEKILDERTAELTKVKEYDNLRTVFFANVSHELRTPLNVIFSSIQLLESTNLLNQPGNFKFARHIGIIRDNSYRLMRLINNLLDITKIDCNGLDLNLSYVNVVEVVENLTLSVVDFAANKDIELIFDTEVEELYTAVDTEKLERIILNLLSNAFKFTNEGGNVTVMVCLIKGYAKISVKDTGIGIPKEKLDIIFDRFVQVDPSINRRNEGSGIGLSLVKSMVEMHGGYVEVQSNHGKGSEFKLYLPLKELSPLVSDICPPPIPKKLIDLELSDIK